MTMVNQPLASPAGQRNGSLPLIKVDHRSSLTRSHVVLLYYRQVSFLISIRMSRGFLSFFFKKNFVNSRDCRLK